MPRYIDADALKSALENNPSDFYDYDELIPLIDAQPTVSPDEMRGVGKWICDPISTVSPVKEWYCSICKQPAPMGYGKAYVKTRFCPSCGAKMEVTSDA